MTARWLWLALCAVGLAGCGLIPPPPEWIKPPVPRPAPRWQRNFTVANPLDVARRDVVVAVPLAQLAPADAKLDMIEVTDGGDALPIQINRAGQETDAETEILFPVSLGPKERRILTIWELLPDETPGRYPREAGAHHQFRYEGFAVLESTLAGYGLYSEYPREPFLGSLQLDFYGKPAVKHDWELGLRLDPKKKIDYRAKNDDALDLLRIGESMGMGGPVIGETRPVDGQTATVFHRVRQNGPLRAVIDVSILGWRTAAGGAYDGYLQYTVLAGQELIELRAKIVASSPKSEFFGVGMTKLDREEYFRRDERNGILCQWGQQDGILSPVGLAILHSPDQIESVVERPNGTGGDRILYLQPALDASAVASQRLHFLATWPGAGVTDAKSFPDYLARLAQQVAHPVAVEVEQSDVDSARPQ